MIEYRGYIIRRNDSGYYMPWYFAHKDLDQADDSRDDRYGYAAGILSAKAEIDERIESE